MIAGRRQLSFATLDDAVLDAQHLLSNGYERIGKWTLGQCCHHLAVLMEYPIDGFPTFRFPLNVACMVLRNTIAPIQLRKVLDRGHWRLGAPTDKRTIPTKGVNDSEEVAHLERAVSRLLAHNGTLQASPLYGMLDQETLVKLHRIHTAHHLSFLIPSA